jgi:hypothetical protein
VIYLARDKDDKDRKSNRNKTSSKIQDIADSIRNNMNSLYRTTYFSDTHASDSIKSIGQSINDNIDKIVTRNLDTLGKPSVSMLYTRLINDNKEAKNIAGDLNSMFEDPMMMDDLYSTFMSNRYLKELDDEIDTVCKYMPELREALCTKKDAVLSADHFSKDFLNIKFPTDVANDKFSQRIREFKKKYKLLKLTEDIYDATADYGEKFTYVVPYKTAIQKLLDQKPQTSLQKPYARMEAAELRQALYESYAETSDRFVLEMTSRSCTIRGLSEAVTCDAPQYLRKSKTYTGKIKQEMAPILNDGEKFHINIEVNKSGIIESAIQEAVDAYVARSNTATSMKESFENKFNNGDVVSVQEDDKVGVLPNTSLAIKDHERTSKNQVKVLGAVVKFLEREKVIPIYIEETCMGYYYIELRSSDADELTGYRNLFGDPMTGMASDGRSAFNGMETNRQDETIKYVAGQLSQFIDKKFVNANQDLAKEIYAILNYNDLFNTPTIDNIKITFVPPEDIHHSYFTFDNRTHRGVSDLARGLIPAKLYSSLYITNTIGIMTRGQDKRVYKVKQMVDTNTAAQLLNVISQIKQGNFGIRQFNSINNVLNLTGRFNEYVIPTGPGGDSPIDIDVISGQQFDVHTDLMDALKEMAINSTEVPYEIIQTRQSVDYASQITMSSSKFLRTVYKRQERFQEIMSPIITAIYNYEYDENVDLDVTLPPPVFLDMANTNQLIDNTKNFVESIIDIELQNEQDEALKSRYRQNLFMHYIGTHIDISAHQEILNKTRVEIKEEQKESQVANAETPSEDDYNY